MIEALSNQSILCKIEYKKYESIQRIKLSEFEKIKDRIFPGLKIFCLCYFSNKIYGWSELLSVKALDKKTSYRTESKNGLSFVVPNNVSKVISVELPYNFFEKRDINIKEFVLGIGLIKNIEIKISTQTHPKLKTVSLKKFLNAKNIKTIKLLYNNYSFVHIFKNDFPNMFKEYCDNFYFDITSVYFCHLGLKNRWFISQVFTMYPELDYSSFLSPFGNEWIFQLLYGKNSNILIKLKRRINLVCTKGIFWKIKKTTYVKSDLVELEIKRKGSTPVLIDNYRAIRYIQRKKKNLGFKK